MFRMWSVLECVNSNSKNRLIYIDFIFPLLTAYEFCALQGDNYDPPTHSELELEEA